MSNKRKPEQQPAVEEADSSDDEAKAKAKATPSPKNSKNAKKKARRTKTSLETLAEGQKFLKKEAPELVAAGEEKKNSRRVETRNDQAKRELINDLADTTKTKDIHREEITADEEARMRKEYAMLFRLFDKDRDNKLTSRELGQAIKSAGKSVDFEKVNRIIAKVGADDFIEKDEFVNYFMKRKYKTISKSEKERKDELKKEKAAKEKREQAEREKKAKADKAKAKEKAKKAGEKEAAKDKGKGKGKAKPTEKESAALKRKNLLIHRSSSIIDFYGPNVFDEEEARATQADEHSNPSGVDYDLVKEGVFEGINVLVGLFYSGEPTFAKKDFESTAGASLKKKGFHLIYARNEAKFIQQLENVDVAWIISDNEMTEGDKTTSDKFIEAVREFHESGGGLYIWANNDPFFFHANLILENLLGIRLKGKSAAGKDLNKNPKPGKGHLIKHEVFTGIQKLFEGRDICFPAKDIDDRMIIFARSNDDHPVIMGAEQGPGGLSNKSGRIMIDTGFTKLWQNWPTQAGTPRYVTNATCWLMAVDHKLKLDYPISRVLEEESD